MTRATARIGDRRLYLCTPDRPDLAQFLAACVAGGVDVVQLRDKVLDARPLVARALVAAAVCRDLGVPFVLNDRPDLALECEADGVHVGQDDASPALARGSSASVSQRTTTKRRAPAATMAGTVSRVTPPVTNHGTVAWAAA